jgi:hypothetical protein
MVDCEEVEVLDQEYERSVKTVLGVWRLYFDDAPELPYSARAQLLWGRENFFETDFGQIPAFGMWAGRGKSSEELVEDVSGRWDREA